MLKFDISQYDGREDKVAMLCETEAQAKCFLNFLHSIGRRWRSGDTYTSKTFFNEYHDDGILYYFDTGRRGSTQFVGDDVEVLVFKNYDWREMGYKWNYRISNEMSFDDMFFCNDPDTSNNKEGVV